MASILVGLPKLVKLELWGTEITDVACEMLKQEPCNLFEVSVNDTNVSKERKAELEAVLQSRIEARFFKVKNQPQATGE